LNQFVIRIVNTTCVFVTCPYAGKYYTVYEDKNLPSELIKVI